MKVTLEVPYGIGGSLPSLVFDIKLLPPQDAEELARLVAATKAEKSTKQGGQMSDIIRIEDAGETVELKQPISDMSPAFKALRAWLNEHSRQGTRNAPR